MSDKPTPPVPAGTPAAPRKKSRVLLFGCGGLLAVLLIIVASVAITVWWLQRPIKPVVLTPKEKTVVEQKLRTVEESKPASSTTSGATSLSERKPPPGNMTQSPRPAREPEPPYTPGSKTIKLTEREINGLLNQNTDLGKSLRFEFGTDAINAYLVVPIPQDFPIGGGKMFRARGRFRVSIGNGGTPVAMLEDVTIFGVSMPKAWLGGLKGENLLNEVCGHQGQGPVLQGIKSLRVEPGALVLELED